MHGTDEEGPIAILIQYIQLHQLCNLNQATTIHYTCCFECRGFRILKQMVKGLIHVLKKIS